MGNATKYWFTADTHFGQQRTLDLSRRPFASTEEMDAALIKNWNAVVAPLDVVFHLGDFGTLGTVKELNGKIELITGNYEDKIWFMMGETAFREKLLDYGFASVQSHRRAHQHRVFCNDIPETLHMVHKPDNCIKNNPTTFNLFGHVHGLCKVKRYGLCVSTDAHNFTPISTEEVSYYYNAIKNHYDSNVFD